jgi:predicted transcriptional regulator
MPGRNSQERFRILERRKRVAGMYLRGMSQWEIGRHLGVTQQCVAKDVHALEKEWLASAVVAIDAAKAKELARIDRLERIAWRAWRRSCQRKERATTRMERKLDEDAQKAKTVTSKATELRDGNPEYLKRVEWCISKRCELLKLNPPQRLEHGGSAELPPIQTEMQVELTRAQRFVRIASLLADGGFVPPDAADRSGSGETPDA